MTHQDPARGSGRSTLSLIAAATLVGLVVVTAVVVAVTRHGDSVERHAKPVSPSTAPVVPVAPGGADGFGVPLADLFGRRVDLPDSSAGQPLPQTAPQHHASDPDWLTAAPAGLDGRGGWQLVHGATVPFSTSDGPTRVSEGAAAGYAHTPQGAVLAAAYTFNEIAARPGDLALLDVRAVLTPQDRAQFQIEVSAGRLPLQQPDRFTRYLVAPDAFRIDQYSDDFAVVRLASRASTIDSGDGPTWTTGPLPMVWDGDDWRLRFAVGEVPTETIHDLAGWTQWNG